MKTFYTVLVLICCKAILFAQAPSENIPSGRSYFHERIDIVQKEIVGLDGVNTEVTNAATADVDNLQSSIEKDARLDNTNKIKFLRGLDEVLREYYNGCKNRRFAPAILPALVNAYKEGIPIELTNQSIEGVIAKNSYEVGQILSSNFAYNKNVGMEAAKDQMLCKYLFAHPAQRIQSLSQHPDLPCADSIITLEAHRDPETIYNRGAANDALATRIHNSEDPLVKAISRMSQMKSGRLFFPFLDDIYHGKMSFEQVDSAIKNDARYYKVMVQTKIDYSDRIRLHDTPMAMHALLDRMASKAKEVYVNEINALHESPDNVRFKVIDNLSPEELYYLAVLTEEEIYTSSYVRGVYPRVFRKLSRGDSLLMNVRFDHFKKWIKMAANYNTLSDFLKRMDKESSQVLMKAFVKGLDKTSSLEDAVDVANSFASINDKNIRNLILNEIQYSLQKAKDANNKRGKDIYNILNILFLSMDSTNHVDVSKLLGIPPVYFVPNKALQDSGGKIIVQQFFYGDQDGRAGFNQFVGEVSNSNWKITGNDQFITVTSTRGTKVVIYANRPLDEQKNLDAIAQKAMDDYLSDHNIDPTIVIHRGHSYYLRSTLEQLVPSAKIVLLGSCGGYQSLNKVLTVCPTAHIVASKQTGSGSVNGPIIITVLETLRQGKELNWPALWKTVARSGVNKELFDDYVPPYKNLGALFIMAYNRMAEKEN